MTDVDGYRSQSNHSPGLLGSLRSVGSKFREKIKISTVFYNYGLNCSRHSYLLITLSILLFCFCCYPIIGIHLFQSNFSQQYVTEFDTFDDVSHVNSNATYHVNTSNLEQTPRKGPDWVSDPVVQFFSLPEQENLISNFSTDSNESPDPSDSLS